jgi:hypothetical protein
MYKLIAKTVLGYTVAEVIVDGSFTSVNRAKTRLALKYGPHLNFTKEAIT